MSKADRCTATDDHGHRCRRKAGHESLPAKDDSDRNQYHLAYDHSWKVEVADEL